VTTPSAAEAIDAMWKRIAIASGVLAILFAVLLGQGRRRTSALEAQLRADEAERTRLVEAARSANERVLTLTEERKGDRALIGQLWGLVHAGQPKPARPEAGGGAGTHDIGALRRLAAANGGDLNQVIRQILTPEALNATLERHADQPAFWVAAASLCGEPVQALEYLESAAARFPEAAIAQAALIEAKRALPQADEATLTAIENLRQADPTSSLADHYDAYFRFKEGDVAGAVQAVAAASEKDRFADHRLELLMSRYQCLRENGCSDGGALALSAFSLGFEHLPMLRDQRRLTSATTAARFMVAEPGREARWAFRGQGLAPRRRRAPMDSGATRRFPRWLTVPTAARPA
jgi:hypothetical protein